MEGIITYSVLRYLPSTIAGEKINLGIIIENKEKDFREFYFTKKLSRITSFDDTVKRSNIIKLLNSIKSDVEKNLFNYNSFEIEEYTKYYKNNYYFEKPKKLVYDNFEQQVLELKKTYFRFDFEKDERPTEEDDIRMLERVIRSEYQDIKKKRTMPGTVNESLQFDFILDDYKLKILSFENKDLKRMVNTAKAWVWNCMQDKNIVLICITPSESVVQSDDYRVIMNVFNKSGVKMYNIDEGIDFIRQNKAV